MIEKSKIFVDGNCIVCDFEIAHYKRIAPDLFDIVDISLPEFEPTKFGLTREAVNTNMHVLTPSGEIKIGVDAFIHIWSRIKKYRPLAKIIGSPFVRPIARTGYKIFTIIRPYLPKKIRK